MAEEIIFKIGADASGAERETDALEKDLIAANAAAEELMKTTRALDATFEDVYGDLKPLSARIGEMEDRMYELALAGQQNTQEFKDLQGETARFRQAIISVDKAVDQLAEQGRGLGAALQIGTTITAGYGALQGAMAAVSGESEHLEKVSQKMQIVFGVLTSLEQLKLSLDKQSIVVTKARAVATVAMTVVQQAWTWATSATTAATVALRVAMLAIPFVAIIAAVVALVAVISDWLSATEDLTAANDKLTRSFEVQAQTLQYANDVASKNIENRIRLAKAEGASLQEVHELELEQIERRESARKKELDLLQKQQSERQALREKAKKQGDKELLETIDGEIRANRERYYELRLLDAEYQVSKTELEASYEAKRQDEQQKAAQKANERARRAADERARREEAEQQQRLDRERLMADYMIAAIEDEGLRSLMAMQEQHKREREEVVKRFGEDTLLLTELQNKQDAELRKLNSELDQKRQAEKDAKREAERAEQQRIIDENLRNERAELEARLLRIGEDFEAEQELRRELAFNEMTTALQNTDLTEGEKFKIKEEYLLKLEDLETESLERQKQHQQEFASAVKSLYENSYNAISSLSEGIFATRIANAEKGSAKELQLQREAFEFNKKLQIAQATIQGFQAVQNMFTSAAASPFTAFFPAYPYIQATAAGAAAFGNILKIKATTFQGGGDVGTSVQPPQVVTPQQAAEEQGVSTLTADLPDTANKPNKVVLVDSEVKAALDNSSTVAVISSVG